MSFTVESLARWLETAGTRAEAGVQTGRLQLEAYSRIATGKEADRDAINALVEKVDAGAAIEDVRVTLMQSLEAFSRPGRLGHDASAAFRHLSTIGDAGGQPVSPELIGECIALYRLVLGRDPDITGFRQFAARRDHNGVALAVVAAEICGSAEAISYHSPSGPPAPTDVAMHTKVLGTQIVGAVTCDVMSERVARLEDALTSISGTLNELREYVVLFGATRR